jgi:hypothetical protein
MARKKRATKTGSGAHKAARANKNCDRRRGADANPEQVEFIRHQSDNRWPSQITCDKYASLNKLKRQQGQARDRKPAPVFGFYMLESIDTKTLDKLLTAASLQVKKVRRYPGWVLQRTYNLKNRVLDLSM